MITLSVNNSKFRPDCPTNRPHIYLQIEARFPLVAFFGMINFADIADAIGAPTPTDYFIDTRIEDSAGRFWKTQPDLWDGIDNEAIREALRDVMAVIEPRIIEEAGMKWICNHPANLALAARVVAGALT